MTWQAPARPGYEPLQYYPPPPRTSVQTHLFIAVAVGAVFALGVYVARAPIPRVLGSGLVFAVGSFGLLRALDLIRVEWPIAPNGRAVRLAGIPRWRLNGFDALTDSRPGMSQDLRFRLRALAVAILARHDLTPGTPGAIALLGSEPYALLFPPDRVGDDRPPDPTAGAVTALIDRLIELGEAGRPKPPAAEPSPAPTAASSPKEGNR